MNDDDPMKSEKVRREREREREREGEGEREVKGLNFVSDPFNEIAVCRRRRRKDS